jgi:hypothetical protein
MKTISIAEKYTTRDYLNMKQEDRELQVKHMNKLQLAQIQQQTT